MNEVRTKELTTLKGVYGNFVRLRYEIEPEFLFYLEPYDLQALYHNVAAVAKYLESFITKDHLLEDIQEISAINKQLNNMHKATMDHIDTEPYSDGFVDCIGSLADIITNYCSLYVEEGKSNFIGSVKPMLLEIKAGWKLLVDRMDLNMSTQDIIKKTRRLIQMTEDVMKMYGTGDSLLSVSEHYMNELQNTLTRDLNDCKIDVADKEQPEEEVCNEK